MATINYGPCECCGGDSFPSPPYPCPNICGKPIGCEGSPPADVSNGWWQFVRGTGSVTSAPYIGCVGGLGDVPCAVGWVFDTDDPFTEIVDGDLIEQIDVSGCDTVITVPCEAHVDGLDDQGYVEFGTTHTYLGVLSAEHPCAGGIGNSYTCQEQATFSLSCKHSSGKPVCTYTKTQEFASNGMEECQCVIGLTVVEACVLPQPYTCPTFPLAADTPMTLTYVGTDFTTVFEFKWVPP